MSMVIISAINRGANRVRIKFDVQIDFSSKFFDDPIAKFSNYFHTEFLNFLLGFKLPLSQISPPLA